LNFISDAILIAIEEKLEKEIHVTVHLKPRSSARLPTMVYHPLVPLSLPPPFGIRLLITPETLLCAGESSQASACLPKYRPYSPLRGASSSTIKAHKLVE
jgi:hypothetical protein